MLDLHAVSVSDFCTRALQGAINIAEFVHGNLLSADETEPLPAGGQSPIDQLVNLRLQAESAARNDRLYQRRSPHWQGQGAGGTGGTCTDTARARRRCAHLVYQTLRPRIDWEDVQRTRIAACQALEEYEEQASQDPKRLKQLLKDVLVVLFHSITPPDRVGVIRRLRFGATLVEDGDGFNIDLRRFKHKTRHTPAITLPN